MNVSQQTDWQKLLVYFALAGLNIILWSAIISVLIAVVNWFRLY